MFENEQSNADVSNEASSTPQESTASESAASQETAKSTSSQEQAQPFHEHPRFKELIEEKNESKRQVQDLMRRLEELNQRTQPKESPKVDPLLARLKGIDPEFGGRMEEISSQLSELQQLKQWKASFEQQQTRTQATSQLQTLHEQNKIPADLRDLYNDQIVAIAQKNPNLSIADLNTVYKQVHDRMTKYAEGIKRSASDAYVQGKRADASVPASAKGSAPKAAGPQTEYSKDPEMAKKQLVAKIMKMNSESRDS